MCWFFAAGVPTGLLHPLIHETSATQSAQHGQGSATVWEFECRACRRTPRVVLPSVCGEEDVLAMLLEWKPATSCCLRRQRWQSRLHYPGVGGSLLHPDSSDAEDSSEATRAGAQCMQHNTCFRWHLALAGLGSCALGSAVKTVASDSRTSSLRTAWHGPRGTPWVDTRITAAPPRRSQRVSEGSRPATPSVGPDCGAWFHKCTPIMLSRPPPAVTVAPCPWADGPVAGPLAGAQIQWVRPPVSGDLSQAACGASLRLSSHGATLPVAGTPTRY